MLKLQKALTTLGSALSELVGLHPISIAHQVLHQQVPIDSRIAPDVTGIKLTQAKVIPHLHLTLACVYILLDRVK